MLAITVAEHQPAAARVSDFVLRETTTDTVPGEIMRAFLQYVSARPHERMTNKFLEEILEIAYREWLNNEGMDIEEGQFVVVIMTDLVKHKGHGRLPFGRWTVRAMARSFWERFKRMIWEP